MNQTLVSWDRGRKCRFSVASVAQTPSPTGPRPTGAAGEHRRGRPGGANAGRQPSGKDGETGIGSGRRAGAPITSSGQPRIAAAPSAARPPARGSRDGRAGQAEVPR